MRTIDNVLFYESHYSRMNIIKGKRKKIIYMVSIYSLKGLSATNKTTFVCSNEGLKRLSATNKTTFVCSNEGLKGRSATNITTFVAQTKV